MILDTEHPGFSVADPFNRSVKQIDMRNFKSGSRKALFSYRKAVILRCYLNLSGAKILYRVIASPVSEFELVGLCSAGKAYKW